MLSLKDRADHINNWVQELFTEEVWSYIRMSREELRKLTPLECAEIAFILRGQSLFIQLKINKINSCVYSYEYDMGLIMAPMMKDYDKYTKYEEKKYLAIRENEVLSKMSLSLNELSQKKEALEFLSLRLENLVISLVDIRRAKYELNQTEKSYS